RRLAGVVHTGLQHFQLDELAGVEAVFHRVDHGLVDLPFADLKDRVHGVGFAAQDGALFTRKHKFLLYHSALFSFKKASSSASSASRARPRWLMASFSAGVSWA